MSKPIVDGSWVRKDFYIQPPTKDAPAKEWEEWIEADKLAAAADKRKHTMGLKHADTPENMRPKAMSKIGGVWRQSPMVGLVGSVEDGSFGFEAVDDTTPHRVMALREMEAQRSKGRSTPSKKRAKRNRRRKRALRLVK